MDWLKHSPRRRKVREEGRWSIGWLKESPNERKEREGGRWSKGWLNSLPKDKRVKRGGRWSKGELYAWKCNNFNFLREWGRWSREGKEEEGVGLNE